MAKKVKLACGLILLLILVSGCVDETKSPPMAKFSLMSQMLPQGGTIPTKYTCHGNDTSLPLSWGTPPEMAKSLALIIDDSDAPGGVFTHWVLFDLPANIRSLPEGIPKLDRLDGGGIQGINDFDEKGYNGPCPPPGKPHTYRFILYALDAELNLKPGSKKEEVLKAMEGHVLGKVELDGKYGTS